MQKIKNSLEPQWEIGLAHLLTDTTSSQARYDRLDTAPYMARLGRRMAIIARVCGKIKIFFGTGGQMSAGSEEKGVPFSLLSSLIFKVYSSDLIKRL